jgi:hypothetical protein
MWPLLLDGGCLVPTQRIHGDDRPSSRYFLLNETWSEKLKLAAKRKLFTTHEPFWVCFLVQEITKNVKKLDLRSFRPKNLLLWWTQQVTVSRLLLRVLKGTQGSPDEEANFPKCTVFNSCAEQEKFNIGTKKN